MVTLSRDPKVAYVVTSGEYSDYRVMGVFDVRARAESWLHTEGFESRMEDRDEWGDPAEIWRRPGKYEEFHRIEKFRYFDGDVLPLDVKL